MKDTKSARRSKRRETAPDCAELRATAAVWAAAVRGHVYRLWLEVRGVRDAFTADGPLSATIDFDELNALATSLEHADQYATNLPLADADAPIPDLAGKAVPRG